MAGYVGILSVELHFPENGSWKGEVREVGEGKLRRFGATVAEVEFHELGSAGHGRVRGEGAPRAAGAPRRGGAGADRGISSCCAPTGRSWFPVSNGGRKRRVNEAMRKVLSDAIPTLKDPRIGFVTVTGGGGGDGVRARDRLRRRLRLGSRARADSRGLRAAHGVLQAQVAARAPPATDSGPTFEYDPTVEQGVRLGKMIDELARSSPDDDEHG